MIKVVKRRLVMMNAPENLYNMIDGFRKQFRAKNGMDLSLIQAGELFAKGVKMPQIPNLLKHENNKKKR